MPELSLAFTGCESGHVPSTASTHDIAAWPGPGSAAGGVWGSGVGAGGATSDAIVAAGATGCEEAGEPVATAGRRDATHSDQQPKPKPVSADSQNSRLSVVTMQRL